MAVPIYTPLEREMPERKKGYSKAAAFLGAVALVAVVVTIVAVQQGQTQSLAKAKASPLKYGSKITLMTSYNEYIVVDKAGTVTMDGYTTGNNVVTVVNPKGKKGAVKYGDKISLMGQNGKYFVARYSGKINARSTVIATDSEWTIVGGSGGVQIGDRVSLKDEFGYMTVNTDGASSIATQITVMQKYLIGMPGQENGLRRAHGLKYGDIVTLNNNDRQYLQIDHNGWGTLRGHPTGNWDHFAVLSNEHREGHISYGDRVTLRAHNGRFVSIRTDNRALEAVSRSIAEESVFQILGSMQGANTGYVHSRDMVVLRGAEGFLDAVPLPEGSAVRAVTGDIMDPQASPFQIKKVWDNAF